jgi:hypothetical protein
VGGKQCVLTAVEEEEEEEEEKWSLDLELP